MKQGMKESHEKGVANHSALSFAVHTGRAAQTPTHAYSIYDFVIFVFVFRNDPCSSQFPIDRVTRDGEILCCS